MSQASQFVLCAALCFLIAAILEPNKTLAAAYGGLFVANVFFSLL